jgi:nitrogen-specific signal transduction histidine kinase
MLNENDYTEMIKDQRDMIRNLDERLIELEEENRLLKIKIKQYESYDN